MKRVTGLGSFTFALAVAGQALVGGCGGDDDSSHSGSGGSGAKAGASGAAGKASGGSSAKGGKGASGGAGGTTGQGGSGASGGTGGTSSGGAGGSGASGGTGGTSSGGSSGGGQGNLETTIAFKASGIPIEQIAASVIGPVGNEYEGMGEHSGESVVLGLKIKLTGITLGENPPGQPNARYVSIFDWSQNPRELAIENGFSGTIEDTASLTIPDGRYQVVQVNYLSQYDLKAYAYLDTDKNGEVDTTIYTTPTGVVSIPSIELPDALPGLDYRHNGFTYTHNADSPTDSTTMSFDFTMLPTAVRVGTPTALLPIPSEAGAGGEGSGSAGSPGEGGMGNMGGALGEDEDPPSRDLAITLYIDSYRVVKAWDGTAPSSPSDHIDVIFPQGPGETRSNSFGVDLVDLYPPGQPAFGLQYLPTFAFASAHAENAVSESYLIAPSEPFLVANSQPMSVIFDAAGIPVIGRTGGNTDAASLIIGQAVRMFERAGSDHGVPLYRYYVEYGIKDENDVDDGGMYYHDDKTMAGHVVEGFRHLAIGGTAPVVVKDGPRCNAEYNRCLGDRQAVIRRVR